MGADICVAVNGRQAVENVKTSKFDLILMDLQMPEMDGYEATKKIREMGLQIPIIALTAHALGEHRDRALKSGFTDYLTKPIKREDLVDSIERHLNS